MIDRLVTVWREAALMRSPLLADIGPQDRKPWRILLAIVCGLVGGLVAVGLLGALAAFVGAIVVVSKGIDADQLSAIVANIQSPSGNTLQIAIGMILVLAVVNGVWFATTVAIASRVNKTPFKANVTAAPRFRFRLLTAGLVLYGAALGLVLLVQTATGQITAEMPVTHLTSSWREVVLYVVIALVGLTVAAGVEELVFRGWLLRLTATFTRNPWIVLLLNGVLFSLIHLDADLNSIVARAVMGVVFCYMALRFGGIEFAIGAHTANNLLIVLFVQPITLNMPAPEPFQAHYLIESVVLLVMGIALTEAVFRIPALRRWTGAADLQTETTSEVFR